MSTLSVDFITPKNSSSVTIRDATVVPAVSSLAFASTTTGCSVTITCQSVGKLVEVQIPALSFTSTGVNITAPAITGLPTPSASLNYFTTVFTDNDANVDHVSFGSIGSNKVLTFFGNVDIVTPFVNLTDYTIHPTVMHYVST